MWFSWCFWLEVPEGSRNRQCHQYNLMYLSYWHAFEHWSLLLAKLNSSESCASPLSMARRRACQTTSNAGWQDDGTVSDGASARCFLTDRRTWGRTTSKSSILSGMVRSSVHINIRQRSQPKRLQVWHLACLWWLEALHHHFRGPAVLNVRAFNTRLCLKICAMSAS